MYVSSFVWLARFSLETNFWNYVFMSCSFATVTHLTSQIYTETNFWNHIFRSFNLHPDLWFEKSRSVSNPRKISGFANLEFFLEKNWVYTINLKKFEWPPWKKLRFWKPGFLKNLSCHPQNQILGCRLKGCLCKYVVDNIKDFFSNLLIKLEVNWVKNSTFS